MHIMIGLASNVTNELVMGWCITERVKRLASDEIELGMMIPTIESRASNIPMTKGLTYVVIAVWLIKIFVEYVGTNMSIQVPLFYWSEMCLDHVYIVLEPVGSARLTFCDDLYYELCDLMTEVCSESRMRSRTWRGVSKWSRHKDPSNIRIFTSWPFWDSSSCPWSYLGLLTNFNHQIT